MRKSGSFCSQHSASQLSTAQSRGGSKYPPVHTMVLLGLQPPPLGEHSGNEGGRADGDTVCKTSTAAGINTFILRCGQASKKKNWKLLHYVVIAFMTIIIELSKDSNRVHFFPYH